MKTHVVRILLILTVLFHITAQARLEMGPQFPPSVYPEYNKQNKASNPKSQTAYEKEKRSAARRDNLNSQIAVALDYLTGNNRPVNEAQAFKWLKLAEQSGNLQASVYLAAMYYFGKGTKQNYDEAFKRFSQAAEDGNTLAQFNLHIMYDVGYGVLVNKPKALFWLRKSAEGGFTKAQTKLGMMYKTGGISVQRDLKKALTWLHRAAENGDKEGQIQLAKIYAMGIGARKNNLVSYIWFNIAGEKCSPGIERQQCLDYTRSIESTLSSTELVKARKIIQQKKQKIAQNSNSPTFEKVIIQ
jgi:TPR repeat protein